MTEDINTAGTMTFKDFARLGGSATKKKYGTKHYQDMAKKRWDKEKEGEEAK